MVKCFLLLVAPSHLSKKEGLLVVYTLCGNPLLFCMLHNPCVSFLLPIAVLLFICVIKLEIFFIDFKVKMNTAESQV